MITQLQFKAIYYVGLVVYGLAFFLQGGSLSTKLFGPSQIALAVMLALLGLLDRWLWRCRVFRPWLVSTPDLIGTYKGTLQSNYKDPKTGEQVPEIPAFIVIRQTLSSIHLRLMTKESKSVSVGGLISTAPDGQKEVLLTYRNEPGLSVRDRSPIHYGGARLEVANGAQLKLNGGYWTDRSTCGDMDFVRISKDTVDSFEDASNVALPTAPKRLTA